MSCILAFSQKIDTTSLTLKGGYGTFIKSALAEFPDKDSLDIYGSGKEDRSYVAQFQVKKDGSIGSEIYISGLKDTFFTSRILRSILKTQGRWVNHTGADAIAIINIYYAFTTDIKSESEIYETEPKIVSSFFKNGIRQNYVFLKPIIIQAGPTYR